MQHPYLIVTHQDTISGSILLSDLDDDDNALQNRKIPVYVPESGSIQIPLDQRVINSVRNGTIKGFLDNGLISIEIVLGEAESLVFDNTASGLSAEDVQAALDEIVATGLGGGAADEVTFDNTSTGFAATDVQAAIDEHYDQTDDVTNLIQHGQQSLYFNTDIGSTPSAGQTTQSWNNDFSALRFDWISTTNAADNGIWRFSGPNPPGYTGGDLFFRVWFSTIDTGSVGEATQWRLGITNTQDGIDFNAVGESYNFYSNLVDMENIQSDVLNTFQFTIPEADWQQDREFFFVQLERQIADAADTFDFRVYVHKVALVFTGWGFRLDANTPT